MDIEDTIFKRTFVNIKKLIPYGFIKDGKDFIYKKKFLDNSFETIISISKDGKISGMVIDLEMNEEYLGLRSQVSGSFALNVREEYTKILNDIKNKCCEEKQYINNQTNRINNYIKKEYKNNPEFLWDKFPSYGVYRNKNNKKWYAIIMNIDFSKLGGKSKEVEIINVKLKEDEVTSLLKHNGFYKAYHMNKNDWISIVLDDSIDDEIIYSLIDESYNNINEVVEWIVPANPSYYDVINCFNNIDEIIWKQSSNIHVNDIVYLYVASPYSKIMYKCVAIETDIPYKYKDKNVRMNSVMKIRLLDRLDSKNYTFEYLNKLGIKSIRGPRKITKKISSKLE